MASIRTTRLQSRGLRLAAAVGVAAWLAGAWQMAAADVVYKWVDPQGRVHYSDRPPTGEGKLLSIEQTAYSQHHSSGVERTPTPPPPPPAATANAANSSSGAPGSDAQLKQKVAADVDAAQAGNCKKAQERYEQYTHFRHLYKEGANGERVYLTDAQLDAERLSAKRELDELCSGSNSQ